MVCLFSIERQGHAKELIKTYDISSIDGIILSSGDGLLYEVGLCLQQCIQNSIIIDIFMLVYRCVVFWRGLNHG